MADTSTTPVQDRLLHITDIHFWEIVRNPLRLLNKRFLGNLNVALRRSREIQVDQAPDVGEALLATGVRTVLASGDFSSTATPAEFRLAINWLNTLRDKGLNIIAMPGNHDVYTFGSVRNKHFHLYFKDYLPEETLPTCIMLPGGTPLVLAPTVCPNLISSRGYISEAEIETTASLVKKAPAGPVLVATHYPVLEKTYSYNSKWGRRLRNADLLHEALGTTGRQILVVAGHVHRFSYAHDRQYPNLHHLTTAACFLHRRHETTSAAFSEIEVAGEQFAAFGHIFNGFWEKNRFQLQSG